MKNREFRKCTEVEFEISNNFASNLFSLMRIHKMSRHDLCNVLNIRYSSFNRVMISQQRVPVSLILKCCEYFNVTIDQLISRERICVTKLI